MSGSVASKAVSLKLDDATMSWDVLAAHVEAFLECWESGSEPPNIGDHLPEKAGVLRHMLLAELVKIDLDYRRQRATAPCLLEDYVAAYPELSSDGGLPADLIYEEYHVRKSAGETVGPTEYLRRFPDHAEALRRLFQLNTPTTSTSLTRSQCHAKFKPGDRVDDFQLLAELGKGAFGCVFLARQESMQRLVALKLSNDRGSEAQTLAQLDHPHIVRVYDQRRLTSENLRLLYMQFAPGGTLQSLVDLAKSVDEAEREYNEQAVIRTLEGSYSTFWNIQFVINALAFPLGWLAGFVYAWPVIHSIREVRDNPQATLHPAAKQRSLRIGRFLAMLGIAEWLIAGLAYPISLHLILGSLGAEQYAHFFGSLLVCGMIAAAYPFFLLSTVAIRAFLPALLRADGLKESDACELQRLARSMSWFLYLAGGVPAAGVMLLVTSGMLTDQQYSFELLVLSAMGAVGFAFAISQFRTLQADIDALLESSSR